MAWRRWRKSLYAPATLGEIAGSLRAIRARRYDEIVDSQGLLRSALIARLAHGRRHGYDAAASASRWPRCSTTCAIASAAICTRSSATASSAAWRSATRRRARPISGSTARALPRRGERYAVLLHATARPEKQWPEANWIALGKALGRMASIWCCRGARDAERARSERIAAALPRARVPERAPLDAVARLIAGAQFVVGVDTGLMHLAAALGVPLVAIFAGSKPGLTGPVGRGPIAVLGAQGDAAVGADVTTAWAGADQRRGQGSGQRIIHSGRMADADDEA